MPAWPLVPLTNYVVGTVVPPLDLNSFQSAINALFGGTQTIKGLQTDGAGGNVASVGAGNILASGSITGSTLLAIAALSASALPTTSYAKGTLGVDTVFSAWCVVNGSTGALRGRAVNIQSVTRNSQGAYTIVFKWSSTAATDIAPFPVCIGTVPQLIAAQQLSTNSVKVFINGAFGGSSPQDSDFALGVIAGT